MDGRDGVDGEVEGEFAGCFGPGGRDCGEMDGGYWCFCWEGRGEGVVCGDIGADEEGGGKGGIVGDDGGLWGLGLIHCGGRRAREGRYVPMRYMKGKTL